MAKIHKVTGPLATPYLDTGERIYLYEGAELPSNLRKGEVKRLTELGLVSEVEVEEVDDNEGGSKPAKVDDILAEVGDDKEKAQAALDAENASAKPRTSLVAKLEAVIAAEA